MTLIQIGADDRGAPVQVDVEELLATRLLVQGNSGSGKSHLLRRLLEESAGIVQQIVIDPEGDFVSLADIFDHVIIDASAYSAAELKTIQEVVTLTVFAVFSVFYLKESLTWNHAIGFALIAGGAAFIFKG